MGWWFKRKTDSDVKKEKVAYDTGLAKSRLNFAKEIKKLNKKYREFNDEYLTELENILITSDMGMKMVIEVINRISKKVQKGWSVERVNEYLINAMKDIYDEGRMKNKLLNLKPNRTNVILMVGVNGAGKTTTIAKLAQQFKNEDQKVLLIAGDTFRAGAVEQLDRWAERIGVRIIKPQKEFQDPASVVFDGIRIGFEEKYDIIIIDTAGRLQNKINLMNELEKMNRIISRVIPHAPHETLLVIDAITGQNGINQAKSFSEVTDVTGIVLTKMDGTAKGGIILAIKDQLNIPVKLIGLGEKVEDLQVFDIDQYLQGVISNLVNVQPENSTD